MNGVAVSSNPNDINGWHVNTRNLRRGRGHYLKDIALYGNADNMGVWVGCKGGSEYRMVNCTDSFNQYYATRQNQHMPFYTCSRGVKLKERFV